MSEWANRYLGLTFEDAERPCWELVREVFARERGVRLPAFGDAVEQGESEAWRAWRSIPSGSERGFDLVMFKVGGIEAHVGLVTRPGQMIQVDTGISCRRERYSEGSRMAPMVSRFLRHEALA